MQVVCLREKEGKRDKDVFSSFSVAHDNNTIFTGESYRKSKRSQESKGKDHLVQYK